MGIFDGLKRIFSKEKSETASPSQPDPQDVIDRMFEAHKNRKIYKVLKAADIDATPDENLVEVIWDNLTLKLNGDWNREKEVMASLSLARQAIWQIWLLEAEVNNGGILQFYDNSSGEFAELMPDSLRLVGAPRFADLMDRTHARVVAYRKELAVGTKTEDDWFELTEDLDAEFFKLYETEPLGQIQIDFIRRNKEAFVDA